MQWNIWTLEHWALEKYRCWGSSHPLLFPFWRKKAIKVNAINIFFKHDAYFDWWIKHGNCGHRDFRAHNWRWCLPEIVGLKILTAALWCEYGDWWGSVDCCSSISPRTFGKDLLPFTFKVWVPTGTKKKNRKSWRCHSVPPKTKPMLSAVLPSDGTNFAVEAAELIYVVPSILSRKWSECLQVPCQQCVLVSWPFVTI